MHFEGWSNVFEFDPLVKPTYESSAKEIDQYHQWEYDNKSVRHLLRGFISIDFVNQFELITTAK